jgi:pentatricopeptide repeat protein
VSSISNLDAEPSPSEAPPSENHVSLSSYIETVLQPVKSTDQSVSASNIASSFQSSIHTAIQSRKYHHVIQLFQEYAFDGLSPASKLAITTYTINCYLEALVHLGRMRDIEEALTLFDPSVNRPPNPRTYAILLRAYILSLNLRKARLLLFEMISSGIEINKEIVHIVLHGEGKWAVSLESVDSLLNLFGLHELEFRDMQSYNIIIDAYLRRDRPDKARNVLDEVVKSDLHPDAGTYYALMKYQARKEGSRGVKVMLNSMTTCGITPELRHLNVLILRLAAEQNLNLDDAASTMSPHNLVPDSATCNIVLRGLFLRKSGASALRQHFETMKTLRIPPDAFTFTILLNEYKRKDRGWKLIRDLLRDQLALNPEHVNRITNNVVLHHMISNFTKSRSVGEPVQYSQFQLQWDLRTITNLVTAYAKSGETAKVVDLYRKVKKRLVKLDRRFYRVLVKALLHGKYYAESMEVASSLYASDDIIDQIFGRECKIRISYTILRHTGRGGKNMLKDIDDFLKFTDEKGATITEKHCNLIAVALLCVSKREFAIQLLESRYHARGRFQDLEKGSLGMSAWTILMRAYARKGSSGIQGLRSCVSRALSNSSEPPTRTFLNFLYRLSVHTHANDCDFFFEAYNECVNRSRKVDRKPVGKKLSHLTRDRILMWVNQLDKTSLKEKLRESPDTA